MKKRIASALLLSVLIVSSCNGSVTEETEQSTKAVSMENLDYAETTAIEDETEKDDVTTVTDKDGNPVTLIIESGESTKVITGDGNPTGSGNGGNGGNGGNSGNNSTPDKYTDIEIEPVKDLTFGNIKVAYYFHTERTNEATEYTLKGFEDALRADGVEITDKIKKALTFETTSNSYTRSGISEEHTFGEGPYFFYNLGGWCGGYISSCLKDSKPFTINFEQSDKCKWKFNFSSFEQRITNSEGEAIDDSYVLTEEEKEAEDQVDDEGHYYFELMKNGKIIRDPEKIPSHPSDLNDTDVKAIATTLGDFEKLTNTGNASYLPKTEITYYVDVKGDEERKELKVGMSYQSLVDMIGEGVKVETTETNEITGEVTDKTYYIYKTDEFTLVVETFEYEDKEYESPLMEDYPDDKILVKTIILLDNEFEYRESEEETSTAAETATEISSVETDAPEAEDSSAETTTLVE